jgi:hypothetical protein
MRKVILSLVLIFAPSLAIAQTDATEPSAVRFERHQFTITRKRSLIYIDGQVAKHPLQEQPLLVSLIETFDELDLPTDRDFFNWARRLQGTRTYTYDNAILKDAQGREIATPLVLLPKEEQQRLNQAWTDWLAKREAERVVYQQPKASPVPANPYLQAQQDALQQLVAFSASTANSAAVLSGETSLWEVELLDSVTSAHSIGFYTPGVNFGFGSAFHPTTQNHRYLRVYARTSLDASSQAAALNPGHQISSIRRISGF